MVYDNIKESQPRVMDETTVENTTPESPLGEALKQPITRRDFLKVAAGARIRAFLLGV